jgi:A/G-specific adenine glycosylase
MKLSPRKKAMFQKMIMDFYAKHGRGSLPWRKGITAYKIYVSEIMLQQTQVERVIPFFKRWMRAFPTVRALAQAPQSQVLALWKGLGYNSRALRMKKAAQEIVEKHRGIFPKTREAIQVLPGIGPYTAGAIMAFAYNQSVVCIETNIRRVFIYHFFKEADCVHDRDILDVIEQTVDVHHPREWYWALMDYGSFLVKTVPNPNRKSRHYTKQSKFEGSDRQLRGKILGVLLAAKKHAVSLEKLAALLAGLTHDRERVELVAANLEKEGFVRITDGNIILNQ